MTRSRSIGMCPRWGLRYRRMWPRVAADGAGPELLLGGQPFLEPLPHGGRSDGGVVAGADLPADPDGVGQRPGGAQGGGDRVGDPDGRLAGRRARRWPAVPGPGPARPCAAVVGGEAAVAQRGAAGAVGARRELELVVPGAVAVAPAVAAPQPRALAAERPAGARLAAAAQLVRGPVAHRVLLGRGAGRAPAWQAGRVESAGRCMHALLAAPVKPAAGPSAGGGGPGTGRPSRASSPAVGTQPGASRPG